MAKHLFVLIPYTWIDSDNYSYSKTMVVKAPTVAAAVKESRERIMDGDEGEWGVVAPTWGSNPERDGADFYYNCGPCDCGDEGCAPDEDGNGGHETLTVCVQLHSAEAKAFGTYKECEDHAFATYRSVIRTQYEVECEDDSD